MHQSSVKIMNKSRSPFRISRQDKSIGNFVTDFFSSGKGGKMNPDSVHYKIFLCAAGYEPEIRRITIDKDICHNYFYLKQKILAIFPTLKDVAFTISWKDSEGDNIRICTDDELVIALKEMESQDFKKIYVNATPQGKEGPVHPDVICDGCEHPLHGFRYKCLVCYDYDLCPDCERSQMHPDHPMLRIPLPLSSEMPFGRRFARDIAKMGKHLERLLHQTTDHMGDKKAKGDYSGGNRSGMNDNRKQHKTKFCPHSDMQNFLHNLVYSQLEKMRGSSGGDTNAASNDTQPENSQPRASSSTDGCPIFEEQKKFVNILTNGLNSFLDPLGIDIVVEEDPVKEENPQKHPQPTHSENDSGENKTSLDGGASTSQTTSNIAAAPIVNQPSLTQNPLFTDPPVSVASSHRIQPQPSASIAVQSAATIGVPPPASMIGSQSSASVSAQPSPTIGFQLPPTIGVPPPVTVGVTPSAAIGVQPPSKITVGAQVPVSNIGVPVMVATPIQTPMNPAPQPQQMASPAHSAHSYQEELPVLDSSWTIVNDGMGESMILQPSPALQQPSSAPLTPSPAPLTPSPAPQQPSFAPQQPSFAPQQPSFAPQQPSFAPQQPSAYVPSPPQETERLYPQLVTPPQLSPYTSCASEASSNPSSLGIGLVPHIPTCPFRYRRSIKDHGAAWV
ncbi:uncharacterized protein [Halyomorpha halys]|uniref:uncharacterized protein isoform X2 n=1 Tax=Halyomorpha halys TaxID=286706 RepID=UPI0006D4FBAD|nr:nascent polypeptide-associated complex subunit alpha, muscle-specific form-like isoform X2 [Halyomorpha halys]